MFPTGTTLGEQAQQNTASVKGSREPWSTDLETALAAFHEGRYLDALSHYRAALKLAEQGGGSPEVRGRILRGVGACWLGSSYYEAALEQFLEARPFTIQGGNREDLAALDTNIASVYLYQGDLERADRLYKQALSWLKDTPRSPHRPTILANRAAIELRQQRYPQALESLQSAARALEGSPAGRSVEANVYDLLGLAHLGLGQYDQAKECFERALHVRSAPGGAVNITRSRMLLGRTELERGNPSAALPILHLSIENARQRESRVDLWQALYFRGRAYWAVAKRERAVADFGRSVEVLESIRPSLVPSDALRVAYEVAHHDVYGAYADLLCELGRAEEAFYAVELGRAQSLRALLESRENAGGRSEPETALPNPAPAVGLRQFQEEALGPDTLLLNFHVGEKSAYLWAITDSTARFYRLPAPSYWKKDIFRFVKATETAADSQALGARLYQILLGPVESSLLERRHWIIAAGGDLSVLPFCALPAPRAGRASGESARYLIEQHSFSFAPSASVLYSLQTRASRDYEYEFLGLADPVLNPVDGRWPAPPAVSLGPRERLPRLIASEAEIRACARLFSGRATLLAGFEASKSRLREAAQQSYRYWHFTSHVVADAERPEKSFIALSMPRQPGAPEKLRISDILSLPLETEMVILNGCDSGTGKNLPGAGVIGLARAFLAAGARSVCGTRWRIPDEGGALVKSLYRRLARGFTDRAEALRQAQLEMIRAGDWRSEPRYWAAYFLIGSHGHPELEPPRKRVTRDP